MNLKYIAGLLVSATIGLTSCSDFTEIDAKGNNLLSNVNDLDLLLNASYAYDHTINVELRSGDFEELCGDFINSHGPLASLILVPNKTARSIRLSWDEQGWLSELPNLTISDQFYNGCYYYIGAIANPILLKVDASVGDQAKKNAVKAEAYLLRAYFHFLAVQRFAPAYDPAKASNTTAICYITEDLDIKTPVPPLSIEQFYSNILADVQRAIDLDAIPVEQNTRMRMNKASSYAVKALVLMAMQRFDEAATAARQALSISNTVTNYNESMSVAQVQPAPGAPYEPHKVFVRPALEVEEDYFTTFGYTLSDCITPYAQSFIEPGHVYNYYLRTLALGMSKDDADQVSLERIGEKGYLITNDNAANFYPRCGLRSTQMYLVLAEAAIHNAMYDEAMGYLDKIRVNRIVPEEYAPLSGTNPDKVSAIKYLKMSAETEGLFSVWNYINRKRWNVLDSDFKETITRTVCGINMTITPESKMWVFPIPINVCGSNPYLKPYLND